MSSKIHVAGDDPSPAPSVLSSALRLPPLAQSSSQPVVPTTTGELSDNAPLLRCSSNDSSPPVSKRRIPSFRKSNTFRSSRSKSNKIKANRMIFHNHASHVACVASMNNYHRLSDDVQDTLLISGGEDKCIYVNSLLFGTTRMKMTGHTQRISGLTTCMWSGYPACVVSCSWDESIRIWKVNECFSSNIKNKEIVSVVDSWKTLSGHSNRICCVKLFNVNSQEVEDDDSEASLLIASGSTDGTIKIWNFKPVGSDDYNTDCLFTIVDELNITWYLCLEYLYTPEDGHVLISGSKDNFVRLWNLDAIIAGSCLEGTGSKPTRVIHGHLSKITNVSITTESSVGDFNDDSKESKREYRIITTCHDLIVRIFSLEGKLIRSLNESPTPITGLSVRDSLRDKCDIIITSGVQGGIRVWRSLTGELLHVFNGFPGPCTAVLSIPSPDRKGDVVVFSGGADHTSRVFLYSVEKCLRVLKHKHVEHPENSVKVNVVKTLIQDGMTPLVFAGCNDGTIWCWLLNSGEADAVMKFTNSIHASRVRALVVHKPPTVGTINPIDEDHEDEYNVEARRENADDDDESAFKALPVAFTPEDPSDTRRSSVYNLDLSQPLLFSAGRDRDVMVTLIDSGAPIAKIDSADTHSITSIDIYTASNSAVENFIVTGSESNNARIFSLKHGNLIQVLSGHDFDVTCVKVFTPQFKPPPAKVNHGASRSSSRQNSARNHKPLSNFDSSISQVRNPLIMTSSMDNTIIIWIYDLSTKSYIQDAVLSDSPSYLSCLAVCQLDDFPVIAAGNGDGDVYLWKISNQMEMDQRDIEYSLSFVFTGCHTDEIFDVSIYNPEGLPPILASGSGDNTLVLWSLEKFERLQTIEGHDGDITSVTLFAPGCSDPLLATASIDGTVRVVSEFLGNLPKIDAVNLAYHLDENDASESWSRITNLVEKFQADAFFQLFYSLFFRALESGLPDFLTIFLPLSFRALIKTNSPLRLDMKGFDEKYELKSLLRVAMEKDNAPAVHVIVSCWVTFFSRNIRDWSGDLIYDEKCNINRDDLLMLANGFPSEFSRLICSISLIPLQKNYLRDGTFFLDVSGDDDIELVVSDNNDASTTANTNPAQVTDRIKDNDNASHDEYTFLCLPINDLCHVSLMKAYVTACSKTDDASIFDSEVGIMTLAYCWRIYGRSYHIYSMKVYLFYTLVSSITLFSFKSTKGHDVLKFVPVCTMILQMVLTFYLFSTELRQLYKERLAYFTDTWNFNDAVVTVCSTTGNLMRLINWEETDVSRVLLSLSIICVHFKVLFYLRAFETSGPLVSMIIQIWNDMQSTVGIIALVIIGFSQAFWLLSEVDSDLPFSSIENSFLNSYSFMLGGYNPTAFDGAPLQSWALFLSVVFMLVMNLLLLNLLIALMGNSYSVVQEKGNAQWRLEQTQVVLDHASQLKEDVKTHSMVYVRKRTEVLKRLRDERESDDANSMKNMIQILEEKIDGLRSLFHQRHQAHTGLDA